jgi:hypothetical protein
VRVKGLADPYEPCLPRDPEITARGRRRLRQESESHAAVALTSSGSRSAPDKPICGPHLQAVRSFITGLGFSDVIKICVQITLSMKVMNDCIIPERS